MCNPIGQNSFELKYRGGMLVLVGRQVSTGLAAECVAKGLNAKLMDMDKFKDCKFDTCVPIYLP